MILILILKVKGADARGLKNAIVFRFLVICLMLSVMLGMIVGGISERQPEDECGCDSRTQAMLHCLQCGNSGER